jgi:hypothetical protein
MHQPRLLLCLFLGALAGALPAWRRHREFELASKLGKHIIPLLGMPIPYNEIPLAICSNRQIIDISSDKYKVSGLRKLKRSLELAEIDGRSFRVKPGNPPYKGIFPYSKAAANSSTPKIGRSGVAAAAR